MPVSMQQIPIGTTATNRTAARALNAIYRNLTGRPMIVITTVFCTVAGIGDTAYAVGLADAVTPPLTFQSTSGIQANPAVTVLQLFAINIMYVPANYYYEVQSFVAAGGAVLLNSWWEISLIEPISGGF